MKNNKIIYVITAMIIIIVLTIINVLRYNNSHIVGDIQGKNWYRYNYNNGIYEVLRFNNGSIDYFKPTSTNNVNSLDECKKYTYNRKNNTINLDCKKTIKIVDSNSNSLTLEFDKKAEKYFTAIEDSLNYEFETYFEKSIIDYKKEREQVTDFSKINQSKLYEVLKEKDYSKIVFIGNNCTSIDCILVLDIMEKWISTNENIYYYDVNNLNTNMINYLNNISEEKFSFDYFNDLYPKVLVVKDNKILDYYEVKCTGFNCTKYYKNEF